LADWPELPYVVEQPGEVLSNIQAWRGPNDAKYRFGVAADADKLYVAIEVTDDQVDHAGDMVWQDFAGVFVNPLVGTQVKLELIKKEAFAVMAGLSMSEEDHQRYAFGILPQGIQTAVKQIDKRLQYEFAIPTSRFSELQDGNWKNLQMNIIVNDHDSADERMGISVMYWRPRWDGNNHYPSSGTFQR
jgi:Carbohydrate family 9 binding domain-like